MMEKIARFRCSASTSLNWGEGCFHISHFILSKIAILCNLGQNARKIKSTPPPISVLENVARFRCSASSSLNWGQGCFHISHFIQSKIAILCYLGQNGRKIKTTPSPISVMENVARFRCCASTSLNWGEGCFYSFYSVQDCSYRMRKCVNTRDRQ